MPSISDSSTSAAQFFTLPFRRKKQRYTINPPDDHYNVVYLGNVLTVMAKGEGCVEKPLNLIWKTYCTRQRADLQMKLAVTRSGLKAETKQQGLTEYWAHRITFCLAPPEYPRVFCWVYKHEGKRMKPELRCHAVLCKKLVEPSAISLRLNEFLQAALQEYRREKICMQNARLSAVATGQVASCPRRKLLLQTGSLNFRPPVSRSKSAPRLGSIDEEDEFPQEAQEEDFSDLDSLCYRESPGVDEDCASSSAASTSSSSSGPDGQQSSSKDRSTSVSHSSTFDASIPSSGPSSIGSDDGYTPTGDNTSDGGGPIRTDVVCCGAISGVGGGGMVLPKRFAVRRHHSCKEPDAVSDESGYHDVSYSDEEFLVLDEEQFDEDQCDIQVTAL